MTHLNALRLVLKRHISRYPLIQVQDLYKLLHQAALGSEHAVPEATHAKKWLETETASMGDGPREPLLDVISPDGSIARLHLRPCASAGISKQVILDAFLRTAEEWRGATAALQEYGALAAWQAEDEGWTISRQEISDFFAAMEKEGYPARHHTPEFSNAYRPAYRVVSTEIWRQYESLHLSPRPDHL